MVGWDQIQQVRQPYRMLRALPQSIWGFLLSEGVDIVEKFLPRTEMLSEICEVNASTTAAEADEFGVAISEEEPQRGMGWKIVNTGTIDPYRFLWGNEPFSNDGKQMLRPYLHDVEEIVSEHRRVQYNSPKLIFAKVARRIEVAFDERSEFASSNTNFALVRGDEGFFYLVIMNSTLLTWIYEQYFGALRMGGGYLQFQAPQLRCLPVPRFDASNSTMMRIANIGRDYLRTSNGGLLSEAEGLICDLYGLTEPDAARIRLARQQTTPID
jgi:hypothetical protein